MKLSWWLPHVLALLLFLIGGRIVRPSTTITAEQSIVALRASLRAAGVTPKGDEAVAVAALDAIFDQRSDLKDTFGIGKRIDLYGLLQWAVSDSDSGTFRLTPYRAELRDVAEQILLKQ